MDAVSTIVTYLIGAFGLSGIVMIGLGYALKKKDDRVDELTNTVIKMAGDNATALVGATAAIDALKNLIVSNNKTEGRTNG